MNGTHSLKGCLAQTDKPNEEDNPELLNNNQEITKRLLDQKRGHLIKKCKRGMKVCNNGDRPQSNKDQLVKTQF